MQTDKINLPDTIKQWRLDGTSRLIDRSGIFDYMNGAGELYLGYHFDYLRVFEYRDVTGNDILVELYDMADSNDAFGLLSLDWGGEVLTLMPPADFPHALYGKGLLRIWSNNLYVRIMAMKETPASREVILQLGKIIVSEQDNPMPPKLLSVLEPELGSGWTLRKERIGYFYSHLVLNSLYYLSHENILKLDHSTEAVIAAYERARKNRKPERIHLLVVNYPDHHRARKALRSFIESYLADRSSEKQPEAENGGMGFCQIEDGWMGYRLLRRYLVLILGCPDQGTARGIMNRVILNKYMQEG